MKRTEAAPSRNSNQSPARDWARALELTAPIARNPGRIFPAVIEERAAELGDAPALLSERECLTYRDLANRVNRYARWALTRGVAKGDCVGLFMPNCPEFMAVWLGITKAGGVVALLNTNVTGKSLAHCIDIVAPKHLIVAAESLELMAGALPELASAPAVWVHGTGDNGCGDGSGFRHLDDEIQQHSGDPLKETELRPVTIQDQALYIYTSGTTGLPKAARVSHGRVMQWSHWFAGMMNIQPTDRLYDCLPMYHSVGGVQTPGAILAGGGSVVLREKFSARAFWSDMVRWDCTIFQYIGELCRYLLHTEPCHHETRHRIRMVCGNGLRPDIWNEFKTRFHIPRILEFYAATEGNVSLFNVEGEPGAVGRIPPYLAHRFPATLVNFDVEKGEPARNEQGFCVRCGPNQTGEMIGELQSNVVSRFEGYSGTEASEKKILRSVFKPGDAWVRSGDLMRRDPKGFFHFVDRIGDTFRWKGENVATTEVSEALCAFPGIIQAIVYGVQIPGSDGRAGMATIVTNAELDLALLRQHLIQRLPEYARPLFIRLRQEIQVTATFKYTAVDLARQGYEPAASSDATYFNDPEREAFVPLGQELYDRIWKGQMELRVQPSHRRSREMEAIHV